MISNKISLSIKWIVCLTNNIYVTYYNYKTNIDKRIKFYKYQSFIFILIILFLTYFNIEYKETIITNKNFSFTGIYNNYFMIFFSLLNICFFIYL